VRVVDSRVLVDETAYGKEWIIKPNDESSLCDVLMGKCCSVLTASDFESIAVQRASVAAVPRESHELTLLVELYYFSPVGEDEVSTAATSMSVKWKELLIAQGVVLTSTTPVGPMRVSRYPGLKDSSVGCIIPAGHSLHIAVVAVITSARALVVIFMTHHAFLS
jgi:hypothetical protein